MSTQWTNDGSRPRGALPLILALAAPFVAGAIGGVATANSVNTWYRSLRKPAWTPPGGLFGPVWTLLYLLMGLASWLVWWTGQVDGREEEARSALGLYGVHLGFNALWSVLFFGRKRLGLALVELLALWGLLQATTARFRRINPVAGAMLWPYQAWATFAALLNAAIWWLNRNGQEHDGA